MKRGSALASVALVALAMDIGQGAGLASASGVRPFLPPLLAGALARGDIGVDFDNTDWKFLESPGFLLAILALAILSYGADRSELDRKPLRFATAALGVVLGAMLFAGSLAEGDTVSWPDLIAAAAAALTLAAIAIFVPPVSFLALVALAFLLARGRQEDERKYAGLRILR